MNFSAFYSTPNAKPKNVSGNFMTTVQLDNFVADRQLLKTRK